MIPISREEKMRLLLTFNAALLVGFFSSMAAVAVSMAEQDERLYAAASCCFAAVIAIAVLWGLVARKWP
jgi:hypothetical protein